MAEYLKIFLNFQPGPYKSLLSTILLIGCVLVMLIKKPSKVIKNTIFDKKKEPRNTPFTAKLTKSETSKVGRYLQVENGDSLLNMCSHNYLNFSERPEIEETALQCLHKYGVGSCGPRGFYGTTEVHLQLEDRLAEFFNCEMAVVYAYGFSTIASAIPAYSKSGDVIFADEKVNFAIQRAFKASRSRIIYFKHNDMESLEKVLIEEEQLGKKDPKKAAATRKFLVVEGIYMNTGTVCNLPEIVRLRAMYKLRLFIDESISFGTLGPNCRGVTDHFNIPLKEVDMIMASLENAAASTGGFCVGTKFVIDHQRLSGLGYCFSASLPPMLTATSITTVDILEKEGTDLVSQLQDRCIAVHKALADCCTNKLLLSGDDISPVKHLLLSSPTGDREEDNAVLRDVVKKVKKYGVALTTCSYLWEAEANNPLPSIRITIQKDLTNEEIEITRTAITKAVAEVL
ncbi:unnamed protein product, partial [Meganyctiphanes norvegica]